MAVMTLIFAVIYIKTISKVGYRYKDSILVPTQENGQTIYTGKIQGEQAQFIVSEDRSVVFQYGAKTYGTYIMKEDSTAIPEDNDMAEQMKGVEIYNDNDIRVIDCAIKSTIPDNINYKKNIICFTCVGVVLICGYFLLAYMFTNASNKIEKKN